MRSKIFRPSAAGVRQGLGEREAAIMEYLWQHGPQSPGDLHRSLSARKTVAYTTIHTELSRLVKKGLVQKRRKNLDALYAASVTREQFVTNLVSHVVEGLIDAHGSAAIHGFVDVIADDEESMNAVKRRLRQRRSKS